MENVKFGMNPGPYLRRKRTTFSIMMELLIGLGVVYLAAIIYNFTVSPTNGLFAILIGVVSVVTTVLVEAIFYGVGIFKDKNEKHKVKAILNKVLHSYGYITALILALLLPVGTSLYVVVISAIVATLMGKLLFGGFGHNIFNPAIIGRVFAQLCFGSDLLYSADSAIQTGATITTATANNSWVMEVGSKNFSLGQALIGNYAGTLGETFTLLLLVVGIVLAIRKVIDWKVPAFYVGTLFIATLIMGLSSGYGLGSFEYALLQISIGGIMFGAVFCMTDPVTNPTSPAGKVIFAVGAALVTLLIRYKAAAPEGVAYSILVMNMLTPFIDRALKGRTNQNLMTKWAVISLLIGATSMMGVGLSYSIVEAKNSTEGNIQTIVESVQYKTKYHVVVDPEGESEGTYGNIVMDVYVNSVSKVVTNIEIDFDNSNCTPGYGTDLLKGTKNPSFYNTYLNFENNGISFDVYRSVDIAKFSDATNVIVSGATYTGKAFIRGVNAVIDEVDPIVAKDDHHEVFQYTFLGLSAAVMVGSIAMIVVDKQKSKKGAK